MLRLKGFLIFLSTLLVLSSFTFGFNSAEASMKSEDPRVLSQETIDLADKFIVYKDNKFVVENARILNSIIGKDELAKVNEEIKQRNAVLSEVTEEEFEEMTVSGNHIEFVYQSEEVEAMSSAGRNGVAVHWWGYKLYLNDNLTNTTAQALVAGAGGAGIVAIWSPWIPPTAVVKAVAATVALVLGGSSAMFYKTNKGKGVYLRFTGILPANVIYTGMFAQ